MLRHACVCACLQDGELAVFDLGTMLLTIFSGFAYIFVAKTVADYFLRYFAPRRKDYRLFVQSFSPDVRARDVPRAGHVVFFQRERARERATNPRIDIRICPPRAVRAGHRGGALTPRGRPQGEAAEARRTYARAPAPARHGARSGPFFLPPLSRVRQLRHVLTSCVAAVSCVAARSHGQRPAVSVAGVAGRADGAGGSRWRERRAGRRRALADGRQRSGHDPSSSCVKVFYAQD